MDSPRPFKASLQAMPAAFDDIEIGQVVSLGTRAVEGKALSGPR